MYIAETSEPGGQISPRPQNREIVNTKLASLNCHHDLKPNQKPKLLFSGVKIDNERLVLVFFYLELCEVWLGWDT